MQDSRLQGATLLSWTLQVWKDSRRGIAVSGQEAAIAYCMQHHSEWWNDWNSADPTGSDDALVRRLIHIHNDAAVRMQVQTQQPLQIAALYDQLQQKGFTEFESVHTIAIALTEETTNARDHNESFNLERYIEKATDYVKQALARPNMTRIAKAKAY